MCHGIHGPVMRNYFFHGMKFNTSPPAACGLYSLLIKVSLTHYSEQRHDDWSACVCVCISVWVVRWKGLLWPGTHSLWNDLKLCVWDAGSQGHGLSPVPTTQRLCPPPSINRDSHSYIPPIHQSSQHIATEKKRERESWLVIEPDWDTLMKKCSETPCD